MNGNDDEVAEESSPYLYQSPPGQSSNSQHYSSQTEGYKEPVNEEPPFDELYNGHAEPERYDWPNIEEESVKSEEEELPVGIKGGNWGKKMKKGARWIRRGKIAAWGPDKYNWELEERARKRLRQLLPRSRSPSPPSLPHLRELTPPLTAPYPSPNTDHAHYATFVLDPSVVHSFRNHLMRDLQAATANLIEGEATMNRALGRLWQVLSEEDHVPDDPDDVAKREEMDEDDDMSERERRLARAPDLSLPVHKLFLTPFSNGGPIVDPSHLGTPEMQLENLNTSLRYVRELQDDSREYIERLAEIREILGDVRDQRDLVWRKIRENALLELQSLEAQTEVEPLAEV